MNLFGYLIPALREVRAPLVGGYLWLLGLWLRLGQRVPRTESIQQGSVWDVLHRLNGSVGAVSVLVILSLAAYLIGTLIGEGLDLGIGRFVGYDEHTLENAGGSNPDAKYLVDLALRSYAEAQLRFHVALPMIFVAIVLPTWAAHLIGLAAALVIGLHGAALVRRTSRRSSLAMSLVRRQVEDRELARQPRPAGADVTVRVRRHQDQSRVLTVANKGPAIARNIDLRTAEAETPSFILSGFFPIEELRPGDAVDVILAVPFGTAPTMKAILTWADDSGERSDTVTLMLL